MQAISQRSESFKGIIGGKYDCLALSAHARSRPIDILYVGESIIDCISHYQLHPEKSPRNLVYLSSEGTLTEGQMTLLQVMLERNAIQDLRTIFDNERQGYKYTLWMYNRFFNGREDVENLSEEAMNQKVSSLSFVDLPNQKDCGMPSRKSVRFLIMTGRGTSTRCGCTTVSSTVGKMWKISVKKR